MTNRSKTPKFAFELYELYVRRHMKELDIMWPRFNIYLSLNTGIVIAAGILLQDHLDELPLKVPPSLWIISLVLFLIGVYLARTWEKVNRDNVRWQLLIDKQIAALEPYLFDKRDGLYASILKDYEATKGSKEDVTDVNVKLSKFFVRVWVFASILSFSFLVLTFMHELGLI
jgi:hypothetical protein